MKLQSLVLALAMLSMSAVANWKIEDNFLKSNDKNKKGYTLAFVANGVFADVHPYVLGLGLPKNFNVKEENTVEFIFKNRGKTVKTYTRTFKEGADFIENGQADLMLSFDGRDGDNYQELIDGMIKYGTLTAKVNGKSVNFSLSGFTKNYNKFAFAAARPYNLKDSISSRVLAACYDRFSFFNTRINKKDFTFESSTENLRKLLSEQENMISIARAEKVEEIKENIANLEFKLDRVEKLFDVKIDRAFKRDFYKNYRTCLNETYANTINQLRQN